MGGAMQKVFTDPAHANLGQFAQTIFSILPPTALATAGVVATKNTMAGLSTPAKTVADSQGKLLEQQRIDAAKAANDLQLQPKTLSPDNFLSDKAGQLAKLRMGLAASVSGGVPGVIPSPTLSAPSLVAQGGGKGRLGA